MRARCGMISLALVLLPAAGFAQTLRGFGAGFNVQRRVFYQGSVYEQTGLWYGASGSAQLGKVRLGLSGLFGTLTGGGTNSPDVTARVTTATLHYVAAPWLALGVQIEARRFETNAGVTAWSLIGGNARLEPNLGVAGLRGLANVSVLPASSVSGGPSLKMAVQATFGAAWAPRDGAVELRVGYRFERYDVAATAPNPERYEQFRGIIAEAGLRLGR